MPAAELIAVKSAGSNLSTHHSTTTFDAGELRRLTPCHVCLLCHPLRSSGSEAAHPRESALPPVPRFKESSPDPSQTSFIDPDIDDDAMIASADHLGVITCTPTNGSPAVVVTPPPVRSTLALGRWVGPEIFDR